MSGIPRVLVIGGAGAFGSRLVVGLVATVACEVVIAGRSLAKAGKLRDALLRVSPDAAILTARVDAATATAADISRLRPTVVVDAAGPYRPGSYGLALACVGAGVHYVDLADGRAFVEGFADAVDRFAKDAGVAAVTGASSTPALSNAALDEIVRGWSLVDTIEVAISPGNRAPRGLSVFKSILAYVGKPVRVLDGGAWSLAYGWGLTVRRNMEGLGPRRLSLCETPDLDVMPARYPDARTVLFRAGLELETLHVALSLASMPVRLGMVRSLVPLAGIFRTVATLFEWFGSDRGGMEVRVTGTDADGTAVEGLWTLVAEEGDGPFVPTLPALALIRRILSGDPPSPGAGPCVGILALSDIEAEMKRFRMPTALSTGNR